MCQEPSSVPTPTRDSERSASDFRTGFALVGPFVHRSSRPFIQEMVPDTFISSFFHGFDDTGCLAVHIEEIIRETMPAHEGKISEDHAPPGLKICALVVLNSPASLF